MTARGEKGDPIIEIKKLTTGFGSQIIHQDLDLTVKRGEILGIVGGSGTGKSVLLKAIIGLIKPRSGAIRIFGEDVLSMNDRDHREIDRRLGVLFQDGALFSAMTVAQNVIAPLREHLNLSSELQQEIASMKITLSGLPLDAATKYPSELSGGMRKRAGLARALAMDPDIVFLDEPTAGLDPIGAAKFDDLIISLKESLGLTVFMVTHDLDSLHRACDRVAVLAEKKVRAIGPLEEVRKNDHPWIQEYFSGPRGRAALASSVQEQDRSGDREATVE
ncbi:ABC transporter ATP-binding protein [Aquisalinus flavus]|uniref:ABC transporter ATP-binding protein n=1 Tax=Aquisalinus flavus TaxID=1526572 RepID=A0A8J2V2K5_9PROT|nr:ABC transporter ATP-binding protein [Aquisalinus flavus]MBD0427506.1 ABC transporter ATP-binding protein [Aquisalinus flavus]UNE47301.1 ABC transporter ATP-binding protein [Aquisalinus flavus]GGD01520.1 ABC transporter ATP-binding protein [Aquisalinus flavus]